MKNTRKIIVVGTGLAGLTTAYRLQEKGYDVHVYEARQRPGGRVLTAHIGESHEELGGKNFLDAGHSKNSLLLIHELKLNTIQRKAPFSIGYFNGIHTIPLLELLRKFTDIDHFQHNLEKVAAHAKNLQEVIDTIFQDPELNLMNTIRMRIYEGSNPTQLDAATVDTLFELFMGSFNNMKKEDAGEKPTYTWLTIEGGNAQLPLALSKKLKHKIHYGKVLSSVEHEDQKFILKFNHTEIVMADLVVIAIPCSMFEDIHFGLNTIPSDQLQQIKKVQYGTNGKILFPINIQNKPYEAIISLKEICWLQHDNKVMTFYYGGQEGIFEVNKAQSLFEEAVKNIKVVYSQSKIHTHQLVPTEDIQFATYREGVFKSWAMDPYAKGSYTNRAPGTAAWLNEMEVIRGEKVRSTFKPVKDKLFFAGEHTTILDALGTMEGAIESGERMARLIDKI